MKTKKLKIYITSENSPFVKKAIDILSLVNINYFLYYVHHENGDELKCSNRPDWVNYFIDNDFVNKSVFYKNNLHDFPGFHLLSSIEDPEINSTRLDKFSIDNTIVWINPLDNDACEYFQFGCAPNNPGMISFYLNNLTLLKRFIGYFKNDLAPEIKDNEHKQPLVRYDLLSDKDCFQTGSQDNFLKFKQATSIKTFHLCGGYEGINLSSRELNCLGELAKGHTAKEVAKNLGISNRTVESHLTHLRDKLSLISKSELIRFAQDRLIDYL